MGDEIGQERPQESNQVPMRTYQIPIVGSPPADQGHSICRRRDDHRRRYVAPDRCIEDYMKSSTDRNDAIVLNESDYLDELSKDDETKPRQPSSYNI